MTTKREAVLAALFAALRQIGGPVALLRNEVLPERIPETGLVILRDGEPGEPEVTLSPLRYHWQHRAEVEVFTRDGEGREAGMDALLASIGAAIAADRTLGGTCDWAEAGGPVSVDLPVAGAVPIRAMLLTVTLHYACADALG